MKDMAEELGYAREVKEYKKEPEKWPGHVGDISTVLRVAITRRRNTPDLYEIMHVLSKANVEKRIELITNNIKKRLISIYKKVTARCSW